MNTVIELNNVVAVLGGFPALAGVSLNVQRGDIALLQGPNGAGKTSVLRVCAGLMPIERGSGTVLGKDLSTQREDIRSRVGLLGHQNGLYLDLTVKQNIEFWASTVGATRDEVISAMARMRLDGRLSSVTASQLSAGQRRRTALASLIVRRAEVWLLDEPHAGLDAAGRDELDDLLRAATHAGATVMLASHESERTEGLATRVITIDGGGAHNSTARDGGVQ